MESLCDVFTDGDWIEAKDQSDSGIRLIQTGNVGTTEYLDKENNKKWISEETFERLHCKEIYEGDILVSRLPEPAGRACIMPNLGIRMITAVDCTIVRTSKEYDRKYLVQYLSTPMYFKEVNSFLGGGTRQRISRGNLSGIDIPIPSTIDEQGKIGEFFANLDHLITLHQRECEQAKKYKKYMLQKMFPQNGSNVPEIRFSGFTHPWEQRKLPEFVTFYNGQTYTPDDVQESGTLVLRSSNVKNGEIVDADNVYINPEIASADNVQEGDIIVVVRNGSRALIGKHAQIKDPKPNTVIGAFMSGMRSEHSSFVNALLDTSAFENEIAKNMGATINQITGYMFSKMEFVIPTDDEQEKIGEYFANLDHLITLHQHKPIQQIIYRNNQQFYNVYFGRR